LSNGLTVAAPNNLQIVEIDDFLPAGTTSSDVPIR
jgi:hypothetical protein